MFCLNCNKYVVSSSHHVFIRSWVNYLCNKLYVNFSSTMYRDGGKGGKKMVNVLLKKIWKDQFRFYLQKRIYCVGEK
jgi:hypothetical protein